MANESNVNTGTAAGSRTYENLRMSGYPFLTRPLTVLSGQSLIAGQPCAKQTASGKIVAYDAGGSGGAEVAYCICARDVDASLADAVGIFFTKGVFNKNAMNLVDTDNSADNETMYDQFRTVGIHLVDSVGA